LSSASAAAAASSSMDRAEVLVESRSAREGVGVLVLSEVGTRGTIERYVGLSSVMNLSQLADFNLVIKSLLALDHCTASPEKMTSYVSVDVLLISLAKWKRNINFVL
jgi:hypothetical protein